ncbi:LysR family transcriptional regulator [Photobacterium sp. 53610]|uniref:LysR family transcriptional regulator n=1 Tax=Photobacterium sp. 53610 TaxID=3102789 RepID=UPI002ED8DB4A
MLPDFSDTFAFVKVVQQGSFTAAAKALNVPKARVSRKVKELEERLGTQLLKRTTRKLGLTEAGKLYFEHCAHLAKGLVAAEEAVTLMQSAPKGWLRVTATYWLSHHVLSPIISEFQQHYPDIQVEVVMSHDIKDLVADDLDIAFRIWRGPLPDSQLIARKCCPLPMHLYASPGYLGQAGEPVHPEDLIRHRALATSLMKSADGFAWPLTNGDTTYAAPIQPHLVASDPELLVHHLTSGQGIGLFSAMRMQPFIQSGQIQRVLPDWTGPDFSLYALLPHTRMLPPKVRLFLDFLITRLPNAMSKDTQVSLAHS